MPVKRCFIALMKNAGDGCLSAVTPKKLLNSIIEMRSGAHQALAGAPRYGIKGSKRVIPLR